MNYNFAVFGAAMATLMLLSVVWSFVLGRCYKKEKKFYGDDKTIKNILTLMSSDLREEELVGTCPVELPNTDDDVADILKYISPVEFASDLLENLYEQARI